MGAAPTTATSISTIGRYQIEGVLGTGATSTVYRGSFDGKSYAIKLMNAQLGSGEDETSASLRFRREAATVARLNHPNLVQILEVGEFEFCAYVVMELVEGSSLGSFILDKTLDETKTIKIAIQVALALGEAHKLGVIHRDIKPDNILVTPNGTAKLIDFGFAAEDHQVAISDQMIGTFQYCSPEQNGLLKHPVDARSDLYSLGAVIFECLTGQPVFSGDTAIDLMRQHASKSAPEAHTVNPGIRPVISQIVAKLLNKDPDDRYQSASGLAHDLSDLAQLETQDREGKLSLDSQRNRTKAGHEIRMVGRQRELDTLKDAWNRVLESRCAMVQIEGEGGSGKSRLTQELVNIAGMRALLLRGKCQMSDTAPFSVIRESIDDLIVRLSRSESPQTLTERFRKAAGEFTSIVRRLSKGLERVLDDRTEVLMLDPASEQSRFLDSIVELLFGLCRENGPLILLIDDTQWIDESSLEVLRRLATRIQQIPFFLLATARNDENSVIAANRFVEEIGPSRTIRIALQPLAHEAVAEFVSEFLGGKSVADRIVQKLTKVSNGNVFAVGEFVRSMLDSGALAPQSGEWIVNEENFAKLTVSSNVIELVVKRVKTLNERTVHLLRIGALYGNRFSTKLIVDSSKQGLFDVELALDDGVRATLIERLDQTDFSFVHDRVREAMLEGMSDELVRDLNQSLADTLYSWEQQDSSDRTFSLAKHFAAGHRDKNLKRIFESNLRAGQVALDNFSNEQAYALLKEALRAKHDFILSGGQLLENIDLDEALGQASSRTGRLKEAHEYISKCLRKAATPGELARSHFANCATYLNEGNLKESWISLDACMQTVGKPFPKTKSFLILTTIWYLIWAFFFEKSRLFRGWSSGKPRDIRETVARMMPAINVICVFLGRMDYMVLFALKELLSAHFVGIGREYARSLIYFVFSLAQINNIVLNYRFLDLILSTERKRKIIDFYGQRSVQIAEQGGEQAVIWYCRYLYAQSIGVNGDLVEAEKRFREVIPGQKRYAGYREPSTTIMVLALNLCWRGYSREAVDLVLQEEQFLIRSDNQFIIQVCLGVAYSQLHLLGRKSEAYQIRDKWKAAMVGQCPWAMDAAVAEELLCSVDAKDFSADTEALIAEVYKIGFVGLYNCHVFALIAYVRYGQYLSASTQEKMAARSALIQSLQTLKKRAKGPAFVCHWYVISAALETEASNFDKAKYLLDVAQKNSAFSDSKWGLYQVALQRAITYKKMGDQSMAVAMAHGALDISTKQGWQNRSLEVKRLFDLKGDFSTQNSVKPSDVRTVVTSSRAIVTESYIQSLLKISLASSGSLDQIEQAKSALDETIKILNAERAFLFLAGPTKELTMTAGRDANLQNLEVLQGYSSTVVNKVFESGKPVVVSGTDEGEVLGSKSAVVHNLRSIIAAPITMREEKLGVIYLDSRLAKGMFTENEVEFLSAIASQIGISVHSARMARIEVERREIEKDLALTGTVQSYFLPEATQHSVGKLTVSGLYRAATGASGDWWWYQFTENGSLRVILGDVTGHGAASAMLTAATAALVQNISETRTNETIKEWLEMVSVGFRKFAKGKLTMTMSGLEVNPESRVLKWWNAAGPPLFVVGEDRQATVLSTAGTPIGDEEILIGYKELTLKPGDRVVSFTDGASELVLPGGGMLKNKGFLKMVLETREATIDEAIVEIANRLDIARGSEPLQDDVTIAIVELGK